MPDLIVRPYQPADRAAVHRIAGDTGFFGEPVEALLDDRRIFSDYFYAYYTDVEPEHAWIACADGEVVGFLAGCVDTKRQQLWLSFSAGRTIRHILRGRYRLGRRTYRYLAAYLLCALRGGAPQADLELYPAHLHLNLDAGWRGLGLGRRLLEAYLVQLRALGVAGVHLETTNRNVVACRLYEKIGFRLLGTHTTRLWAHLVREPVEDRCYGLLVSS